MPKTVTTKEPKAEVKAPKVAKITKVEAAIATPKVTAAKTSGMSVTVFSLLGKEDGTLELPKDLFGAVVNEALLAQALRVYINNLKGHFSNTKTRGEVEGSTRKIYAQKGTGRARHGGIRAPIFVGGGIALGPKSRKTDLELPKKMKKLALIAALSQKMSEKNIFGLSGLDKSTGKTKEFASLFTKLEKKSVLIVAGKTQNMALRSTKNLKKIDFAQVSEINAYEVIKHQNIMVTADAIEALKERLAI